VSKGNPHPVINHRRRGSYESAWKDEGCALHPRCLECPEETCVYDDGPPVFRESHATAENGEGKQEEARCHD
jgi:hypothetical protein